MTILLCCEPYQYFSPGLLLIHSFVPIIADMTILYSDNNSIVMVTVHKNLLIKVGKLYAIIFMEFAVLVTLNISMLQNIKLLLVILCSQNMLANIIEV